MYFSSVQLNVSFSAYGIASYIPWEAANAYVIKTNCTAISIAISKQKHLCATSLADVTVKSY